VISVFLARVLTSFLDTTPLLGDRHSKNGRLEDFQAGIPNDLVIQTVNRKSKVTRSHTIKGRDIHRRLTAIYCSLENVEPETNTFPFSLPLNLYLSVSVYDTPSATLTCLSGCLQHCLIDVQNH
jgi:hypothetical protein